VAAVIENGGLFLMVEERADGKIVINQPAGHLEDGESLTDAVVRETREETGWHWQPESLIGIYQWRNPDSGRSFLRVAFTGRMLRHDPALPLDEPILRTLWLDRTELRAVNGRLRSPMVLRCIDDYLAGRRYPLAALAAPLEPLALRASAG
jgi:8-oxo-dGTP pyrophosphatase MutT (NUDIX family)